MGTHTQADGSVDVDVRGQLSLLFCFEAGAQLCSEAALKLMILLARPLHTEITGIHSSVIFNCVYICLSSQLPANLHDFTRVFVCICIFFFSLGS